MFKTRHNFKNKIDKSVTSGTLWLPLIGDTERHLA